MHAFEFERTVGPSHSLTVELPPDAPQGLAKVIVLFPDQPSVATPAFANLWEFTRWLKSQPPTGRSSAEIDQQVRAEQDSWE